MTLPVPGGSIQDQIDELIKSKSSLLQYPTSITRDIIPKPIHSHNDCMLVSLMRSTQSLIYGGEDWRQVPLFTALGYGCMSVEADVWWLDELLWVGHHSASLTEARTFESLYVTPLLSILEETNKYNENRTSPNGVFDSDFSVSLQLLVDFKTNGDKALPAVLRALEPLRSKGYLTTYKNGVLRRSVITVIGTGAAPLEAIKALSPRDLFYDAPLHALADSPAGNWSPELSPLASTDWEATVGWSGIGEINDDELSKLKKLVKAAHDGGIAARFWNVPNWPNFAREAIWKQLIAAGVDWLNADNLHAASTMF